LDQPAVIVLAAGQGTRMKSRRAKVLHEICGVSMLGHVLRTARALSPSKLILVVGRDADQVRAHFAEQAEVVLQAEQRGTGHAVLVAEPSLGSASCDVLVLYGDTPLLRAETIERMAAQKRESGAALVMLTARAENIPGRVVRDSDGQVARVVEAQDATADELAIEERNTGVYLFDAALLREGLAALEPNNEQGELYLTDIVGHAVGRGLRVEAFEVEDTDECLGINNRRELADAARVMRRRINERHMAEGVSFVDPESVYLDADVRIGRDSLLEPGVVVTGESILGEGVHVKAGTVIEESRLADEVTIGPSAHLRPGCDLGEGVKIGNFVEIKNSRLGARTKAAHLSYIGDADVGADVNFSCGAIVVNYDGYRKTRSEIGDGAFIGCNANLVSPVRIAPRGFVAAGSTITHDVPEDALAVARERQRNIEGWVARREGRASRQSRGGTRSTPAVPGETGRKVSKATSGKTAPRASRKKARQAPEKAARKSSKKKGAGTATKSSRATRSPKVSTRRSGQPKKKAAVRKSEARRKAGRTAREKKKQD
jgi:bifunctional UDP-N-acetylglucosamine pyrophosphorylase/glucosamine-1-phosphate N-acetyltransferase